MRFVDREGNFLCGVFCSGKSPERFQIASHDFRKPEVKLFDMALFKEPLRFQFVNLVLRQGMRGILRNDKSPFIATSPDPQKKADACCADYQGNDHPRQVLNYRGRGRDNPVDRF